ncbi:MAG: hypothetical protein JWQ09_1255 [Segetibacter sp.]|nr:hypothetical protein [Segetibacter sp.]
MPDTEKRDNTLITVIISILIFIALLVAGLSLLLKTSTVYDAAEKGNATATYTIIQQGYSTALSYFTLAVGALLLGILLPRLQGLTLPGGIGVTFKQSLNNVMQQQNAIQAALAGAGGQKSVSFKSKQNIKERIRTDDQASKGWSGKTEEKGRRLTAVVERSNLEPSFYKAELSLESSELAKPLKGLVNFQLTPNFTNSSLLIAVHDGRATLNLPKVEGAFQVIAIADDGATQLELDFM